MTVLGGGWGAERGAASRAGGPAGTCFRDSMVK